MLGTSLLYVLSSIMYTLNKVMSSNMASEVGFFLLRFLNIC